MEPTKWRGPFSVARQSPGVWKIVNRRGDDERLGFSKKGDADGQCRLLNLARPKELE